MRLRTVRVHLASGLLVASVAGCGSVENTHPDSALTPDAPGTPDMQIEPDAPITPDAPPAAPVNTVSSGTVAEGGTLSLAGRLLSSDSDTPAGQLVYTVRALPAGGVLSNAGTALEVGGTFTQQNVDDGVVSYTHDGSETTADGFMWTLSDGTNTVPPSGNSTFAITVTAVNDVPLVAQNGGLTIQEGGSMLLTNSRLQVTDAEPGAITYTVTAVNRVSVRKNNVDLAVNSTFTQQDIDDGLINIVDPGNDDAALQNKMMTTGSFSWRATDTGGAMVPASGSNTTTFNISPVDDMPVVSWRPMRCDTDGIDIPADPILSISDVDTALTEYTLCVVGIENGTRSTTGGGETTVIPNLQKGTVSLTVGSCVLNSERSMLNLDNSTANTGRGQVTFQLKIGTIPILGNATISFPATPTSC
jgi:hypothetical protein